MERTEKGLSKHRYKQRHEECFNNNPQNMCKGIRNITDYKRRDQQVNHDPILPYNLNSFSTRFDSPSGRRTAHLPQPGVHHQPLVLQLHQVTFALRRINIKKAAGPDKVADCTSIIVPVPKKNYHHLCYIILTPVSTGCVPSPSVHPS